MILAVTRPELFGPIIVAGAPLSYRAGVRRKDHPMRCSGGLLGGSWLSDIGGLWSLRRVLRSWRGAALERRCSAA